VPVVRKGTIGERFFSERLRLPGLAKFVSASLSGVPNRLPDPEVEPEGGVPMRSRTSEDQRGGGEKVLMGLVLRDGEGEEVIAPVTDADLNGVPNLARTSAGSGGTGGGGDGSGDATLAPLCKSEVLMVSGGPFADPGGE